MNDFRLVDSDWEKVFRKASENSKGDLLIVCPFIKAGPIERLLKTAKSKSIRVLTRLSENDIFAGVSDVEALRKLLDQKAAIRGIKNLHAKLFIFGEQSVVAGSANLTDAALHRNYEFGFSSSMPEIVNGCREYFESLWARTGNDLDSRLLDQIESNIAKVKKTHAAVDLPSLKDHGASLGLPADPSLLANCPERSFIKFSGSGRDREKLEARVVDVLNDDCSHYLCAYPKGKRPRQPKDGDVMFIGCFVEQSDLMIYGRGVAQTHKEGRDDATSEEIEKHRWKEDWPHFIRIHSPEFVAGILKNGVSLNELMKELGPDCFLRTKQRVAAGEQNVKPKSTYQRQPQVQLSDEGWAWVNGRLEAAFKKHGKLSQADLASLVWPPSSKISKDLTAAHRRSTGAQTEAAEPLDPS